MTALQTLAQFIAKHDVKMQHIPLQRRPDDSADWKGAYHFQCVISHKAGSITAAYSMGSGHATKKLYPGRGLVTVPPIPELDDVLNCLKSDSEALNARDFEEWAGDLGWDTDSIKALRCYEACLKTARDLRWLFGPEVFEELLACEPL